MPSPRQKHQARVTRQSERYRAALPKCGICGIHPVYEAGTCKACLQDQLIDSIKAEDSYKSEVATPMETALTLMEMNQKSEKKIRRSIISATLLTENAKKQWAKECAN